MQGFVVLIVDTSSDNALKGIFIVDELLHYLDNIETCESILEYEANAAEASCMKFSFGIN